MISADPHRQDPAVCWRTEQDQLNDWNMKDPAQRAIEGSTGALHRRSQIHNVGGIVSVSYLDDG